MSLEPKTYEKTVALSLILLAYVEKATFVKLHFCQTTLNWIFVVKKNTFITFRAIFFSLLWSLGMQATTLKADAKVHNYLASSAYFKATFDRSSKIYNNKWAREINDLFEKFPNSLTMTGSKHPQCPHNFWWNSNKTFWDSQGKLGWQEEMRRELRGFPESTVKKCLQFEHFVLNGKLQKSFRHERFFRTGAATVIFNDKVSGEQTVLRALISSDLGYRFETAFAKLYNENLQEVCIMKNFSGDLTQLGTSDVSCRGIGKGRAQGKATNLLKGEFVSLLSLPKAEVFITNLPPAKAISQFSTIQKRGTLTVPDRSANKSR